jgi:PAS domain S-box-containing protein
MARSEEKRHLSGTFVRFDTPGLARAVGDGLGDRPPDEGPPSSTRWQVPRSPFPMWIYDARTGAILAANGAAARMYGYDIDELLEHGIGDVCPDGALDNLLASDRGIARAATLRHRRKDGSIFEADVVLIEASEHGQVMVLGDPAQFRRDAEDTRSVRLPRQPTTLAFLHEHALAATERARVQNVERALARDSTAFGSSPRDFVQPVCDQLRAEADAKHVDLVVLSSCKVVRVRPSFREALHELVHNAVRASPRGFPVFIDVRETAERNFTWRVQDAGAGMNADVIGSLRSGAPAPWRPGSGLGIVLTAAIIERHGGSLHFESAAGVGTSAIVELPGNP